MTQRLPGPLSLVFLCTCAATQPLADGDAGAEAGNPPTGAAFWGEDAPNGEGDAVAVDPSSGSWGAGGDAAVVTTDPPDGTTNDVDADAAGNQPVLPFDAGAAELCAEPIAAGDLAIDEVMIESVAGTGDFGEWVEVASRRDCVLNLRGLQGECPRGSAVLTFDVADDLWIPPNGSFVIADSSDSVIDHALPDPVLVWTGVGKSGDVLRNKGGTVTLRMNGLIVDSITYPALKLTVGGSVSFPADCDPTVRSDWTRWQTSTSSWFPGFLGTPNAPNVDVRCRKPLP